MDHSIASRDMDRPVEGEIYFEYIRIGQTLRVIAVDAQTGTEVTVMGPLKARQDDLQRIALRKLKKRLSADRI